VQGRRGWVRLHEKGGKEHEMPTHHNLKNGGRLEIAHQMAAHESARTTGLYDRRSDEVSLDEVERIGI
jgi:hypothetical protein